VLSFYVSADLSGQSIPKRPIFPHPPNRSHTVVTSVTCQKSRNIIPHEFGDTRCSSQSDRNDTASHALKKRKAKPFVIRQEYHGMALCQVFRDLIVFYKADQMNRQTFALLTKYLLYHSTVRPGDVDQSFGPWHFAHSSAKSVSNFGDPLLLLNQSPHVSKPQPPVGFFRY